MPALKFSVPKAEWKHRPNGILNEYNPGTMMNRVLLTLAGNDYPIETLVEHDGGYVDLALPRGGEVVSLERALERRSQICDLYKSLLTCDVVIITLGLVEAWYDNLTKMYVNQKPPNSVLLRDRYRFELVQLSFSESFDLLQPAVKALVDSGKKLLLTVSPVPLMASFSGRDALIANEYSKSSLRVCAEMLFNSSNRIDYFPSYEMVRYGGAANYNPDAIHVKDAVVGRIVDYMMSIYVE